MAIPEGNVRASASSGKMLTDVGYTGQRLDSTGLMFYNARYYNPYLNRWIQPDTIVPDKANPQSLNRYSYVRNNPLKYVDPSGHRETECDPGTSGCDLNGRQTNPHDLTSYLAKAMTAHGDDPRLERIADAAGLKIPIFGAGSVGGGYGGPAGIWVSGYTGLWELEGTKAVWDIKQKILQELKYGVILCGEVCDWYDYSTPGNIHFGYIAGRAAISHNIAAIAGGLAELADNLSTGQPHPYCPVCDNPQDQAAVDFGYFLAEKYQKGISAANFRKELTVNRTSQFQRPTDPSFQPPYPAAPGANNYGPDYFNWR